MKLAKFKNLIKKSTLQIKNTHKDEGGFWFLLGIIGAAIAGALGLGVLGALDEVIKIGIAVVSFLIAIPGAIAALLFSIAADISIWLVEFSLEIPITSGWAYEIGWKFTRDFANMFFILILAVIGIATILRIREYQFQKTLPKLIVVALLINFSPVIVGVIVDVFNLATGYFVHHIGFTEQFLEPTETLGRFVWQQFTSLTSISQDVEISVMRLAAIVILMAYFVLGTFVFLVIGILFLVRVIAFWVLFVLSPLAFLSIILPATKGFWDMWWKQIIQWGLVGLTAAFFLYLSSHLLTNSQVIFETAEIATEMERVLPSTWPERADFAIAVENMAPFVVAFAFIIIGIVLGLSSSAMGANLIITHAKKGGKWAGGAAAGASVGAIRGREPVAKAERAVRKELEKMPVVGRAMGGRGAYEKGVQTKLAQAEKEIKGLPKEDLLGIIRAHPLTPEDRFKRAAAFKEAAERNYLTDKEKRYVPEVQMYGVKSGDIYTKHPHWAGERIPKSELPSIEAEAMIRSPYLSKERGIKREATRRQVGSREEKKFKEEIAPSSLRESDVFLAMDMKYIKVMKNASRLKKKALATAWQDRSFRLELGKEINHQLKLGTPEGKKRANELLDMIKEVKQW